MQHGAETGANDGVLQAVECSPFWTLTAAGNWVLVRAQAASLYSKAKVGGCGGRGVCWRMVSAHSEQVCRETGNLRYIFISAINPSIQVFSLTATGSPSLTSFQKSSLIPAILLTFARPVRGLRRSYSPR